MQREAGAHLWDALGLSTVPDGPGPCEGRRVDVHSPTTLSQRRWREEASQATTVTTYPASAANRT
jgi:hypothetical protein